MRAVGVIPARYQASRFPGKPLAPIAGVPMIERVWRGARGAKSLARVIVATDDARIADACRSFGAEVALTRAALAPTPAERAEGLEQLRALEHGFPIRCAVIEGWTSAAVDVPADVAAVEARLGDRT